MFRRILWRKSSIKSCGSLRYIRRELCHARCEMVEAEFTPWMSRAEPQYFEENNPAEQYFAHIEGRNNSGRLEYRAVTQPFATDQYEQWAVFWGIGEADCRRPLKKPTT